ncbi:heavy metal translocating P-type ATPase [Psychrobacillus sp. BL-248-WT-3]|uniref:heavy metal translocating P-type ATPase n=1 Tax=Psychrobacillus sp. BL-248-WT-3 TaxID=2725306 RepID=UPI00146B2FC1|nr:heavy metal translocating P-type ATPase [Psychrobacillus sp. BL-248-WT-3]NME07658.1 cadmium-translocating P-type ATPase [Psychrobacillus sp. BL-248-WT-3]
MNNVEKKEYRLENLSCANCARKFENNIKSLPTVQEATVNFGAAKVSVIGDVTVEEIEKAGAFDGIKVLPVSQRKIEKTPFLKRKENVVTLISLIFLIGGVIASFVYEESHPVALSLFVLSIAIGGFDLFKGGFINLTRFYFDMKTLMTIAIIGAAIIGEWREGAVVVFLFALSEALEAYSMNKARQSISELMDIAPPTAIVRRNNELIELDTEFIQIGDVLIVKPGQKIAMDGIVLKGSSTVNQASITGESVPVVKTKGEDVFAGTLNEEGSLEIEVTKRVEDTTIAKIIHLVEEAQAEKAPSQRFVDKFAKYYTPAIIGIAFLVAIIPPLLGGDWKLWIYQGLAVLVVGCPCALVVSTPVAIVTAIGNAAKHGVLIKGGVHLEEIGRIEAIAFDKTGTLTKGYPEVTYVEAASSKDFIQNIMSIEAYSQHPLAKAIVEYGANNTIHPIEVDEFKSLTGKGAEAVVNGIKWSVGSVAWIKTISLISVDVLRKVEKLQMEGNTVILATEEGTYRGFVAIADPIRSTSSKVLQDLKDIGIKHTVMLTGDDPNTANAIAAQLGITDVNAGLMPDQKLMAIERLKEKYGAVAMIGDGVNDSPALAAANVGIAMGGAGTDAALETADVALMADDLEKLPYTISLSRKALHIIKENIMFALGLKIIALLLIIPGWLTLWIAIFADMGATLLVVLNSLRLLNKFSNGKELEEAKK